MAEQDNQPARMLGLNVLNSDDGSQMGHVTDIHAGDDGQLTGITLRLGWVAGSRYLPVEDIKIKPDRVLTHHDRTALSNCPPIPDGLVGVQVRSHEGENLGTIANVVVESGSLHIVGLELSNGVVRDWSRGRALVVLTPEDSLGHREDRYLSLSEEAITSQPQHLPIIAVPAVLDALMGHGNSNAEAPPTGVRPLDWEAIRKTPEKEICQKMARLVWERRGGPSDTPIETMEAMAAPWAAELKKAANEGNTSRFDDIALISGEQVEALRLFRQGAELADRMDGTEQKEAAPADAAQAEAEQQKAAQAEPSKS